MVRPHSKLNMSDVRDLCRSTHILIFLVLRLLVFWNSEKSTRASACSFGTMPVGRERATREIDHALALLQRTYPRAAINGTALVRRFEVWGGINKYQLPLSTRKFPDAFFKQPLFMCDNPRRTSPSIEQAIVSRLRMPVKKACLLYTSDAADE